MNVVEYEEWFWTGFGQHIHIYVGAVMKESYQTAQG